MVIVIWSVITGIHGEILVAVSVRITEPVSFAAGTYTGLMELAFSSVPIPLDVQVRLL